MGMSTAGIDAVTAASYFEDISLTIGLTASDFAWQGFDQGDRDGCKEWPISEETKGSDDFERSTCECEDTRKDIDKRLSAAIKERIA